MHKWTPMAVVDAVQLCVLHGLQSACQILYPSDGETKRCQSTRFHGVKSGAYMLLRVLLDVDCAMGARAQPQINPLRATENPHSVIMTGLLGTLASSTAWKAWLSRCSWHRRVRFCVCSWPTCVFNCCFQNITVGWGPSWLIDYE